MGFKPSRADPDIWIKYSKDGSHYEYIVVYIDDIAIYMEDPKSFCDKLREVAPLNYHLRCGYTRDEDTLQTHEQTLDVCKYLATIETPTFMEGRYR